jgi:hypothetical protein
VPVSDLYWITESFDKTVIWTNFDVVLGTRFDPAFLQGLSVFARKWPEIAQTRCSNKDVTDIKLSIVLHLLDLRFPPDALFTQQLYQLSSIGEPHFTELLVALQLLDVRHGGLILFLHLNKLLLNFFLHSLFLLESCHFL